MTPDIETIRREIGQILPRVTEMRHHLHAHPELALQEVATAEFIRGKLTSPALTLLPPFLGTDVVALISGRKPGRNVTLRADIDALPIHEPEGLPYRSLHRDKMHACGHDGHTAMLLGAALVLARLKGGFAGSVRCVFQPGEENVAAGKDLVAKGALDDPTPDAVLALHGWPGLPLGAIGARAGCAMAAADIFRISVKGRGGHGSRPECAVDPILTATKVIQNLYEIPSRRVGALDPVVVTVCAIEGGSNANVIPEEVVLQGSVRYLTKESGAGLPELFEHAVRCACDHAGASYELSYRRPYLPTVNDAGIVALCRETVRGDLGSAWIDIDRPTMGAEDFSYYTDRHPGAIFFLGMGEESPQLHSSQFDFRDDALKGGIEFLVAATLKLLAR